MFPTGTLKLAALAMALAASCAEAAVRIEWTRSPAFGGAQSVKTALYHEPMWAVSALEGVEGASHVDITHVGRNRGGVVHMFTDRAGAEAWVKYQDEGLGVQSGKEVVYNVPTFQGVYDPAYKYIVVSVI